MAEILDTSQLRYPELERLKMLEECDQLGENEPEYDLMIMGIVFRDMLHDAYQGLPREILMRCVQGYINHCIKKNKLNISRTQQQKVFTAEECWE